MIERPHIESVISHGGDKARMAMWILDCLDQNPPPAGGNLTIYLCYNSGDINCFGSASRDEDLARAICKAYLQEKQWDNNGFGNLRFDLTIAQPPAQLSLTLREDFAERDHHPDLYEQLQSVAQQVSIEFCWQEADIQIGPGTIGLVQRWRPSLALESELCGVLTVKAGASIARHVHRWQREARWQLPEIYLPVGRTEFLLGPWVGCDLLVPELRHLVRISYDSVSDEWRWESPGIPEGLQGSQRRQMRIEHPLCQEQSILAIGGKSFDTPTTLKLKEEANRLPLHSLDIVGFALPLASPNGYGIVPDGSPELIVERANSALRLPNGAVLYVDRYSGHVSIYGADGGSVSLALNERDRIKLKAATPESNHIWAKWQEIGPSLECGFRGELILKPTLNCLLARGVISEDLPEDFFPDYRDVTLGRAPLRLESRDGRGYSLVFKESARHPVFLKVGDSPDFRCYSPETTNHVPLYPRINRFVVAEFILGSTHYRLREISSTNTELKTLGPFFAPAGGIA